LNLETLKLNLHVRAATLTDVPSILALQHQAPTAAHWSEAQYQALFNAEAPPRITLVIEEAKTFHGFIVARAAVVEWEIENVVIASPARKRGLGSQLLSQLLDTAKAQNAQSVFLEVRESNSAARGLYEKAGFVETARRPSYYSSPPEDAILYQLSFL
jgi:ribosomal-protein-alanine N-acetyltransferase